MKKLALFFLTISLLFPALLFGQKKTTTVITKGNTKVDVDVIKPVDDKKTDPASGEKSEDKGFLKKWQFESSLNFAFSMPMSGTLKELYGNGLGFNLNVMGNLTPLVPFFGVETKAGLLLGYLSFSSKISDAKFTATTAHMPIILFYEGTKEFYITSSFKVRPLWRIGWGATRVTADTSWNSLTGEQKSLSESSMDSTLLLGLGCGFQSTKWPFLEFSINGSYNSIFETVSANFLYISMGFHYRFI